MTKIAFVDVDGVVADLGTAWLNRYNKDFDDNLTNENILDWHTSQYVKPECGNKIYDYLEDPTLYDEVEPIPFALGGVSFLRNAGFRVVFATTSVNGASGRKYRWLVDHNFLPVELSLKDYIEIGDKGLLDPGGFENILIDDGIHNLKAFKGFGILFSRPHNIKEVWHPVLFGWENISILLHGDDEKYENF